MRVVIAEKPKVAEMIAKVLGAHSKRDGYLEGNGYQVTWAKGHLVEIYTEESNVPWDKDHLPVIPSNFKLKIISGQGKDGKKIDEDPMAKKQVGVILSLFKSASEIICATDAGREGELIFRLIYEYIKFEGHPFKRLWTSSMSEKGIAQAFNELKDGALFDNMAKAARQRAEADWLVGINATRALSVYCGKRTVLTLGRVQTPTLAIICKRYDENRFFVPTPFWVLSLGLSKEQIDFKINSKVKFETENDARKAMEGVLEQKFVTVDKVVKQRKEEEPPLLFSLTELQKEANKKFGFTADMVADIAQSLYMKGLLSYPRTDTQYIGKSDFLKVPELIRLLYSHPKYGIYARTLDLAGLNSRCVDDNKLTDHGALMVDVNVPQGLTDFEQKLYDLVASRMLEAFSPSCFADVTKVDISSSDIQFSVSGRVVIVPGWRSVTKQFSETEQESEGMEGENANLPALNEGERLRIMSHQLVQSETRPKPILTDSSLLALMQNAGKETDDVEAKAGLKHSAGIGTSATRSGIIKELVARGYIYRDGKKIFPTDLGYKVYSTVKQMKISDVALTGLWENQLVEIENGLRREKDFRAEINTYTAKVVEEIFACDIKELRDAVSSGGTAKSLILCPDCGKSLTIWKDNVSCTKECGYKVYRTIGGKTLTEKQMKTLIETGRTEKIDGFVSKAGKSFSAKLTLNPETHRVEYDFGEQAQKSGPDSMSSSAESLKCPFCGESMTRASQWKSTCSCGFVLWHVMSGKELTGAEIGELLKNGSTGLLSGFKSKAGKPFEAKLKLNREERKVEFDFEKDGTDSTNTASGFTCPLCDGEMIYVSKSKLTCKNSCGFELWRVIGGKNLTDAEIRELLENGSTGLIHGFKSKAGKLFNAKLKLNYETLRVEYDFSD